MIVVVVVPLKRNNRQEQQFEAVGLSPLYFILFYSSCKEKKKLKTTLMESFSLLAPLPLYKERSFCCYIFDKDGL